MIKPAIELSEGFKTTSKEKNKEIIDALTEKLERLALTRQQEKSILSISNIDDTSGYDTDESDISTLRQKVAMEGDLSKISFGKGYVNTPQATTRTYYQRHTPHDMLFEEEISNTMANKLNA